MSDEIKEAQAKEWRRKIDFHEDRARRFHCGELLTRLELWVTTKSGYQRDEEAALREWILEERKELLAVKP